MLSDRNLAIQVLSNIWLFIPFGAILASLKQKHQILLIAVGMSVLIEVSQLTLGLGFCEFDDIIGNSLGAWLWLLLRRYGVEKETEENC